MIYQLASGKTIRLSEEQFFKMTDQDFKDLEGSNGMTIDDPFYSRFADNDDIEEDLEKDFDDVIDEVLFDEEFFGDIEE